MKRKLPLITGLLLGGLLLHSGFLKPSLLGQSLYNSEKNKQKNNILSIDSQSISVKGSPAEESIMACVTLTNNYAKPIEIMWDRTAETYSNDYWESYVIDDQIEWAPFVTEGTLFLEAYNSVELCVNFLSNHRQGEGKITLELHTNKQRNWAEPIEFIANLEWPKTTGSIHVYPNKAQHHIHIDWLDFEEEISQFELHNLIGKKINTYNVDQKNEIYTLDVDQLDSGVYFISLFNPSIELVGTQAFSKID